MIDAAANRPAFAAAYGNRSRRACARRRHFVRCAATYAASAPSVAVKEARAARAAAKKKGGAPAKPTAKKTHARKKY
ncbi:hypothetical protein B1M_44859 [Burkholderia sp. TJI49]|nr:hypothetical protein B1M_44859 [Burkholderia sp. TJI49]